MGRFDSETQRIPPIAALLAEDPIVAQAAIQHAVTESTDQLIRTGVALKYIVSAETE